VMGMWRIRVYQRGMIQVQRGFIDSWPYIYNPCCNFLSRIEGAGTPKTFDSGEPPAPLLRYKIKDHGLASTQKQPIFDIFGLYLGRFLIL
jgi:hypothetical protein